MACVVVMRPGEPLSDMDGLLFPNNDFPNAPELLLVSSDDAEGALRCLETVRNHQMPDRYLAPVVLIWRNKPLECLKLAFDGIITSDDPETIARSVEVQAPIRTRLRDIVARQNNRVVPGLPLKILQILWTRQTGIAPVRDSTHDGGFIYPLLAPLFRDATYTLLGILEFLSAQNLLFATYFDTAFFCSRCNSSILNFREACPDCGSTDIDIDELVHHFRCGYVAPLQEFQKKNSNGLYCPKCDHSLRQLGADYDKPSVVYKCNTCGLASQDPTTSVTCYHCGYTASPEGMLRKKIMSYTLTGLGNHSALNGIDALFKNILGSQVNSFSIDIFKQIVNIEIRRIERYKKTSSAIAGYSIQNFENLYAGLGDDSVAFPHELAALIKNILRSSDITTAVSESCYLFMLPDTTDEQAARAMERLWQGTQQLVEQNLIITPEIATAHRLLENEEDVSNLLKELTNHAL